MMKYQEDFRDTGLAKVGRLEKVGLEDESMKNLAIGHNGCNFLLLQGIGWIKVTMSMSC